MFSLCEEVRTIGANDPNRWRLGKRQKNVAKLLAVCPKLAVVYAVDTLAKRPEFRLSKREYAFHAGAEALNDQVRVGSIQEGVPKIVRS